MEQQTHSVVVAGGGTAGHIEPALAVADALRRDYGVHVTALGTPKGLEGEIVPERGYELKLIAPVPVPRKLNADLFKLPGRVVGAVKETRRILQETKAEALIGFGGYVSAPAYIAARLERIPFFVHEANARAGLANKLGVFLGGEAFTAVDGSGIKGQVVGIPIRAALTEGDAAADAARARELWGLGEEKPTVLVIGGSQGARSINAAVADAVGRLTAQGFQVLHAYGKKNEPPAAVGQLDGYVAVPYITDMAAAYAVADLIVSRAGAMTVAEVTARAVPAIYVPLPHGNGEQGLNAQAVVKEGAAVLVADAELSGEWLVERVTDLVRSGALDTMRQAAQRSASGSAAETIAARIAAVLP